VLPSSINDRGEILSLTQFSGGGRAYKLTRVQ